MLKKGYLVSDNVLNRNYSTLISLNSSNRGDYDTCALAWDLCTGNLYEDYLGETINERLERLQMASKGAFEDFKRIIAILKRKYIAKFDEVVKENTMVILDVKGEASFISNKFDAGFIYEEINNFYHTGGGILA